MDRQTLRQYRALKREIECLDEALERLYKRQEVLPVIMGKVQSSSDTFPYLPEGVPVMVESPKLASNIKDLIRLKERRRKKAFDLILEIERYIGSIEDSTNRQIFEQVYLYGKTYRVVGEELNMDWSTIGKRIRAELEKHTGEK